MSRNKQASAKGSGAPSTPPETASVPPSQYDSHSWVLSAVMENQKSLGLIQGSLNSLNNKIDDMNKTISRHGQILAVATGALLVLTTIGGFTIAHAWDKIVALMSLDTASIEKVLEQKKIDDAMQLETNKNTIP